MKSVSDDTDSKSEEVAQSLAREKADIDTDGEGDALIYVNNAYAGSTNSIGSVHQRAWFLSLDRQSSGFIRQKNSTARGLWTRSNDGGGFEPFHVRGRYFERSVVTGRLSAEVETDGGLEGYVGRAGWLGITA